MIARKSFRNPLKLKCFNVSHFSKGPFIPSPEMKKLNWTNIITYGTIGLIQLLIVTYVSILIFNAF